MDRQLCLGLSPKGTINHSLDLSVIASVNLVFFLKKNQGQLIISFLVQTYNAVKRLINYYYFPTSQQTVLFI